MRRVPFYHITECVFIQEISSTLGTKIIDYCQSGCLSFYILLEDSNVYAARSIDVNDSDTCVSLAVACRHHALHVVYPSYPHEITILPLSLDSPKNAFQHFTCQS